MIPESNLPYSAQKDHVRIYQLDDYMQRAREAGFLVEYLPYESLSDFINMPCNPARVLYLSGNRVPIQRRHTFQKIKRKGKPVIINGSKDLCYSPELFIKNLPRPYIRTLKIQHKAPVGIIPRKRIDQKRRGPIIPALGSLPTSQ